MKTAISLVFFTLSSCSIVRSSEDGFLQRVDSDPILSGSHEPHNETPTANYQTGQEWYFGSCLEKVGDIIKLNRSKTCEIMKQRYNVTSDVCLQDIRCIIPSMDVAAMPEVEGESF